MTTDRCRRCGTKLRNRTRCPCCGLDLSAAEAPAEAEEVAPAHVIKKVAAKAGVKICAICMESVPEDQVVELEGQKLCPACADNMKQKAAKKPPVPAPQ